MFPLMIMTGKSGKESKYSTYDSHNAEEYVLLLESKPKIEMIKEIVRTKKPVIITFDYETHKLLLENKIEHQISDEYITEDDLRSIQESSFLFAKWYEQKPINHLLKYDEINLGGLFYIEFHYLLVPFLKKFVEVSKIFAKFKDVEYLTTSLLYEMMINFTNKINDLKIETNYSNEFLYDVIKTRLKIGGKFITLNIKRSHYRKLKEIS